MQHEGKGPIPLEAIRGLLLPMVRHIQAMHPTRILSIECDHTCDCLLVRMKNEEGTRSIGFAITRPAITTREYLKTFQGNVVGLLNAIALPQDVFDQLYPPEKTLEDAVDKNRTPAPAGGSEDKTPADHSGAIPGWDNFRY